jgi:hypothetical protein
MGGFGVAVDDLQGAVPASSGAEPVVHLEHEDVLALGVERRPGISTEVEGSPDPFALTSLLPDEIDPRTRAVLPPKGGRAPERPDAEVLLAELGVDLAVARVVEMDPVPVAAERTSDAANPNLRGPLAFSASFDINPRLVGAEDPIPDRKLDGVNAFVAGELRVWIRSPEDVIREVLGDSDPGPGSAQVGIAESVRESALVAVRCCNSSGKDRRATRLALWWVSAKGGLALMTGPTRRQVREIVMGEVARAFHRSKRLPRELYQMALRLGEEEEGILAVGNPLAPSGRFYDISTPGNMEGREGGRVGPPERGGGPDRNSRGGLPHLRGTHGLRVREGIGDLPEPIGGGVPRPGPNAPLPSIMNRPGFPDDLFT